MAICVRTRCNHCNTFAQSCFAISTYKLDKRTLKFFNKATFARSVSENITLQQGISIFTIAQSSGLQIFFFKAHKINRVPTHHTHLPSKQARMTIAIPCTPQKL